MTEQPVLPRRHGWSWQDTNCETSCCCCQLDGPYCVEGILRNGQWTWQVVDNCGEGLAVIGHTFPDPESAMIAAESLAR